MKKELRHLLYQNDESAPSVDNINCDLENPTYTRIGLGKYQMHSPSFTLSAKIFLANKMTSNTASLIELSQGEQCKGFVQVSYAFEDNEGVIYIDSYSSGKEPSDGILDNFPLSIDLYEQEV